MLIHSFGIFQTLFGHSVIVFEGSLIAKCFLGFEAVFVGIGSQ